MHPDMHWNGSWEYHTPATCGIVSPARGGGGVSLIKAPRKAIGLVVGIVERVDNGKERVIRHACGAVHWPSTGRSSCPGC